jgi:iron(III) transport system substrate-binding protein
VLIVNTDRVPEADRPTSIFAMIDPRWKGQIALAKPNFGTTATHAACLFDTLGTDAAQDYFRKLQANNVQLVAGNKQVARSVAEGRSAFGLTDTDDAILELLAGKPVTLVYPDAAGHLEFPKLGTLFIPNTLALVRGGPNPEAGKKLIDYLLSPAVETQLAQGGGYQLPVNPELKGIVHPALKTRHQVKAMAPDWEKAADIWEDVQSFLRNEFMRSSGN